jgi:O-antigen/teichoic acid export membrane protein
MMMGQVHNITLTTFTRAVRRMLAHPLASDSAVLVTSQYLAAMIGFLTNIVAARMLGPSDYGTAALIMAYPTLLWSFSAVKSISITTRYLASFYSNQQRSEVESICKLGYSLDFCSAVAALVLLGGTGWWVAPTVCDMPATYGLMVGYASSYPLFSLNGTSSAVLSSLQRFRCLAALQIVDRGIMLMLVTLLLYMGFGILGIIVATAIGQAASGTTMAIVATQALRQEGFGYWWQASLKRMTPRLRELGSFFGWNYVMVTLSGVVVQVPVMLLGRLGTPNEAGFYRLAMSITTIGSYLESALARVAYPVLSARWGHEERQSLKQSLKNWTVRGGLPAGLTVLSGIPFLPFVIPLVFGASYVPMVWGTQMLIVATAISTVFFWLTAIYYASGRVDVWTKAYGLYTGVVIGLSWLSIHWWGFSGLAGLVTVGKVGFTLLMLRCLALSEEASR